LPARLPDLLVIGAPRSGTTTVSHWLRDHPQVAFSATKELQFFDRFHDRGLGWYLDQLPPDPGDRVVVEATTPTYLSEEAVPARVAAALPDALLTAVLREPVARAWSHYWSLCQRGLERRSFERAVAEETSLEHPGYLWRGRYAEQLARWDAVLAPSRLHVILLDDLDRDPAGTFEGLCRFAGIDTVPPSGCGPVKPSLDPRRPRSRRLAGALHSPSAGQLRLRAFQWNAYGRPVPPMPGPLRDRLREQFHDHNEKLAARLDRELPSTWS
jgi:hypothetical protein